MLTHPIPPDDPGAQPIYDRPLTAMQRWQRKRNRLPLWAELYLLWLRLGWFGRSK